MEHVLIADYSFGETGIKPFNLLKQKAGSGAFWSKHLKQYIPVPSGQQEQWQIPPKFTFWLGSLSGISFSSPNFKQILSQTLWHFFNEIKWFPLAKGIQAKMKAHKSTPQILAVRPFIYGTLERPLINVAIASNAMRSAYASHVPPRSWLGWHYQQ